MSALNVTQDEADLLIVGLNMYADVQRNASGTVSDDVKVLLAKLAPAPVVAEPMVAEPVVEETPAPKAKKAKAEEVVAEEAPADKE